MQMHSVEFRPSGHRSVNASTSNRAETPEESHVVRLIHLTAAPMPASIDRGAGETGHHSGFRDGMEGPASLGAIRPLAALGEARLNAFPGVLGEVLFDRVGGGQRRPFDRSPQGMLDATKVGQPAYPGYNPGAGEGLRPFEPEQARAPVDCADGGVAPLPPVTALCDG